MSKCCCEVLLQEILFAIGQIEREIDPDKQLSIRAAIRVKIEAHLEEARAAQPAKP
jgi:hypothetical protein